MSSVLFLSFLGLIFKIKCFFKISFKTSYFLTQCIGECETNGFKTRSLDCVWSKTRLSAGKECSSLQRPRTMKMCEMGSCCKYKNNIFNITYILFLILRELNGCAIFRLSYWSPWEEERYLKIEENIQILKLTYYSICPTLSYVKV